MTNRIGTYGRRDFLQTVGLGAAAIAFSSAGFGAATAKPLRGLFPIGFTPFTPDDKIDLRWPRRSSEVLQSRGRAWPHVASERQWLEHHVQKERLDGAEAILSSGKGGKAALVIGVQGSDLDTVTRYALQAEKLGADGIVSLPPTGVTDEKEILAYYQKVGRITSLPFFAQAVGNISVDLLVEMFKTIPTFRYVKDETGNPLERIAELRERTGDQLKVFSGGGAATMILEMERGFSGACPYVDLADVFASAFDLWHEGKKREAFDMFGRIQAFASITPVSSVDIMIARGVFKPGTKLRTAAPAAGGRGGASGARQRGIQLSIEDIRKELDAYLKPYLKA